MLTEKPKTYMVEPPVIVEPTERWVRAEIGGRYIADSKRATLLIEYGPGKLPQYFFPQDDVRSDLLKPSDRANEDGRLVYWDIEVDGRVEKRAAWSYVSPPEDRTELKDLITFAWFKMDHWYEEEEEVFVHARDPHRRVDVMPSSRQVRIEINGTVVADSNRPHLLFETGLPVRFYLPREDVRMDLLRATETETRCPYKGVASYWTAEIDGERVTDIAWSYEDPISENPKIKNLVCFFGEKVDMWVDGHKLPRPVTPWS